MTGVAAFQMYDFPEIRESTDRFWQLIRSELAISGILAPVLLTEDRAPTALWRDPDMVLSQTCGLPYIRGLAGQAVLIGTPDYGIIPAQPGHYFSVIIVSKNSPYQTPYQTLADMQDSTFAFNDVGSQSGVFAILDLLFEQFGEKRFFGDCLASGSHAASLAMVASGQADIAAIDAVTWRYLCDFNQDTRHVRILTHTRSAPGLPFITGDARHAADIADAVERAIAKLADQDHAQLGICGFWRSEKADYQVLARRAARVSGLLEKHGLGN